LVSQTREIVERRTRVEGLVDKAENNKDNVSAKIYERVRADYQAQLRAIGEEYAPMRDRVTAELKRIRAEERRLRARLDVVNEELEELRFRCQVGEFSEDELQEKESEKLTVVDDLNASLTTIEGTYTLSRELLGEDADSVLKGGGDSFGDEVAVDVGATSGVLPGASGGGGGGGGGGAGAQASATATATATATEPQPVGDIDLGGDVDISGAGATGEARAVLKLKSENGEENFALGTQSLTIGRNPKNDIVLLDRTISRQHARVSYEDGGWILTDLSSGGGLLINGTRTQNAKLKHGDEIELGDFTFTFANA
ncbi:MAG: FHA domain-containing protein, partial [Planctomycetota bacterium]